MLVIASPAMQGQPVQTLRELGFDSQVVGDPYAAIAELLASNIHYRGVVLSLQSVYREEIAMVRTLKRRLPHLEIWLAHTDSRQAALAEAMRLGADGLLAEGGLHRTGTPGPAAEPGNPNGEFARAPLHLAQPAEAESQPADHAHDQHNGDQQDHDHVDEAMCLSEPVLTADELRALLQEQPSMPPAGSSEN